MDNLWILAEIRPDEAPEEIGDTPATETGTKVPGDPNIPTGQDKRTGKSGWSTLLIMLPLFVVMYLFLMRGPQKKQKQQKQMVQALAKNDRVRTIGGIIGTVVDIKDDDVVLKIDESNNTKIRISAQAIGKNLSKSEK